VSLDLVGQLLGTLGCIFGACGRGVGLFGSAAVQFSSAGAIVGNPFSSGNDGNVHPSRYLIPNSLRQHVQRVNVKLVSSLADAVKKTEPPSIKVTPRHQGSIQVRHCSYLSYFIYFKKKIAELNMCALHSYEID